MPRCSANSDPERSGHVRGCRADARPSAACPSSWESVDSPNHGTDRYRVRSGARWPLRMGVGERRIGVNAASVSAWHVRRAARVLDAGGVIVYPSEGVLGLGCDPFRTSAVRRLLRLKRRPMRMGFILIASAFEQVRPLIATLPPALSREVLDSWPGPVTWVLPAADRVPEWLTGGRDTLALRVTAHPLASAICSAFGAPVVSTSANIRGRSPPRHPLSLSRELRSGADYVVPGRTGGARGPTEIRDARSGALLRAPGG